jgi:hypothetical protein
MNSARTLPILSLLFALMAGAAPVGCASFEGGSATADAALPASIDAFVREAYPGQRIVFCETNPSPAGAPVHRVTLDRDGLRTWVVMDDSGEILRERAELRGHEVPLAIMGTVQARFPGIEVPLAIRWREGQTVHYEIRLLDPKGMTSTLQISRGGMIIEDIDGEGVPAPDQD